ncbi:DUF456 domain-containing protein [Cellulomonas sp. WB94]|uniref:DUF456 domain-containing protein n=1 Tax=Cellulomonas sp. WB94 TaxID=2173174 RepID=UPI000D57048B|nr:DUF456 domain-containing protein [Cellulomonas sp. WB94]PVU82323.1 DUF456 domain-containing protein [Cellulomonas sp. WB94]
MSPAGELLVGLVIATGLVGVVVQVLPGSLIVLGAVLVWATETGGGVAWTAFSVGAVAVAAAAVGKYLLAGRHLAGAGVRRSTLVWGGALGVVGFFVVPVVGLPLGFALGVYLIEWGARRDSRVAWRATVAVLRATGIALLVELAGALVAAGAWLLAVLLT